MLSSKLKNDAAQICSASVLMRVRWMRQLESDCVAELSQRLIYRGCARSEPLSGTNGALFVITSGVAAIGTMHSTMHWQ